MKISLKRERQYKSNIIIGMLKSKKCNEFRPHEDVLFLKDNVWVLGKIIMKVKHLGRIG